MSAFPKPDLPNRRNPSAGVHINLGQSNLVLLTVTTENRIPWLANETVRQLLHQTWSQADAWLVGDYLLMPDHLHCFCAPRDLRFTLEKWISYWKREFAINRKQLMGGASVLASRPEAWERLAGTLAPPVQGENSASRTPIVQPEEWKFQSRGWHHRLRNGESYSQKWLYVQENPIRKQLCQRIEDWPFKGRVFDLSWVES